MKKLSEHKGVLLEEPEYFGARCFSDEATARFPELASRLAPEAGQIDLQMGTLAAAARSAIETGDGAFLDRVLCFLTDVLKHDRIHPDVENAVALSFLEPREFQKSSLGKQAWRSMPLRVRALIEPPG